MRSANTGHREPELSEKEILLGVRKILDTIEIHHKEWGRRRRLEKIFHDQSEKVVRAKD